MNQKPILRTKLLILPQFQLKLLGANLAILLVVSGVIWFQMSRAFSDLAAAAGVSGVEAEFYHRYLQHHADSLTLSLAASFVTAIGLSTAMTLFISHRFSGPMVRLRGFFRDLSSCEGAIPRLSFRKGDELSDIPPLVNEALEHLDGTAEQRHRGKEKIAA